MLVSLIISPPRMFIGEYSHNLDDKGRLAVPVKFRRDLSKGAVVTRGLDNCLFVYTKTEWEKLATKLASLPISQANSRAFSRLMLAGAMDVEIDKQGRMVLPESLSPVFTIVSKFGTPPNGLTIKVKPKPKVAALRSAWPNSEFNRD